MHKLNNDEFHYVKKMHLLHTCIYLYIMHLFLILKDVFKETIVIILKLFLSC